MILPIGHEESSLRRLPWVTFGLLGLCVLAFLGTRAGSERAVEAAQQELEAVFQYYLTHPYLELDDAFLDRFLPVGGDRREALLEGFRMGAPPPMDAESLSAEQAELDGRAKRVVSAIESHPLHAWGLVPNRVTLPTLLAHMFLHAGWLHLLGNLLILYLAAPYIEDVWGRPLFGGFYVFAGIVAALAFALRYSDSDVPMIGASGAIAGVMGAFLVRYWHTRIKFFYAFSLLFRGTFTAPAWVMLPLWFGQQLFLASLTDSSTEGAGGGVAHLAHIGGFVFGVGVAVGVRHFKVEERWISRAVDSKTTVAVVDNPALERAAEAEAAGRADEAFRVLAEESARRPEDEAVSLALWDLAVRQKRAPDGGPAMERLIRRELSDGRTDSAATHWCELSERVTRTGLDVPTLLRLAHALHQGDRRTETARTLRLALLRAGTGADPAVVLKIARLARDVDPDTARGALGLALARPGLDPDQRIHAERLLAALQPRSVSA